MEQDQEQKQHLCKLCNKSFSSGKVLGGHMRSHRSTQNPSKKRKKNSIASEIAASYSLRENPKKSWKFSAPNGVPNAENQLQENRCKICGKGFDSSKALFGHMRHHSGRRKEPIRRCKECNQEFDNLKSLTSHMKFHSQSQVADGQSDGETLGFLRRKRSRRARCKFGSNPCCSSSSDLIDGIEPEDEELALCLLMLSRGVGNLGADFSRTHFDLDLDLDSEEEEEEERVEMGLGLPEVGRYYAEVELGMPKLDDEESEMGFCEEEVRGNVLKSLKKGEIEGGGGDGEMEKEGNFQCGVCLKVFGSGQALGGHKRAHLLKPHLMELEEKEEEEDDEFKPWWNGDDDDGQLVGLVSSN